MSPQSHISLSTRPHFPTHFAVPCPVWKWFNDDHWRRERWKLGNGTVWSSTCSVVTAVNTAVDKKMLLLCFVFCFLPNGLTFVGLYVLWFIALFCCISAVFSCLYVYAFGILVGHRSIRFWEWFSPTWISAAPSLLVLPCEEEQNWWRFPSVLC